MNYPPYAIQALQWQPLSAAPLSATDARSSSLRSAQASLKQSLEEQRWLLEKNQHLVVPPTHLDDYGGRIFSMGDFVTRADEARDIDVHQCSLDSSGKRRMLCEEQLQQLKRTGELDVPSQLFENQHHTWKVATGFYASPQNVRHSLAEGVGKSLDHYVVYTRDSMVKKETKLPTLRNALLNGLGEAGKMLRGAAGQLFAGRMKHRTYSEGAIEALMKEAECGYVQHYLRQEGHDTRRLNDENNPGYSNDIHDKLWEALEKDAAFGSDYRRSSRDLKAAEEAKRRLDSVRLRFEANMRPQRNVKLKIDNSKALESPLAAKNEGEHAMKEWLNTKDKAWINHLRHSSTEEEDLKKLGRIEVDRLLAMEIEQRVLNEDGNQIKQDLEEYEKSLKKKHPLLSLSGAWRKRKMDTKRTALEASAESSRLDRVSQQLKEEGLEAQCAARKLTATFRRELREDMAELLRKKLSSFPPAKFKVLQLNPNHWTTYGENGVCRYKIVEVDLGKHFWRVQHSWMTVVTLTKSMIGGAYHFLTSGPFSLRAFFSPGPYYAVEHPVREESSLTQTLASRLLSFLATLTAVRERFEAAPDTGLIGKSVQRFFLGIYLTLKRFVGVLWITTFMTIGTLIATLLNLAVLALAPVIAVAVAVAAILFNLTVYDSVLAAARGRVHQKLPFGVEPEMPSSMSPLIKIVFGVPYFLIFPGALLAMFAVIRLCVVHPIGGTAILIWTSMRFTMRSLRDSITWLFIRRYSRIPASDTFLAWRTHGPGLAPTQFYRLPVDAAKASVLLFLDKYRLQAHSGVRRAELNAPYDRYRGLFDEVVRPFGLGIVMHVTGPSSIGSRIASQIQSKQRSGGRNSHAPHSRTSKPPEHPLDIWDAVTLGVRSSHPDFERKQRIQFERRWEAAVTSGESVFALDEGIRSDVDAVYDLYKSSGVTELDEMVNRAGKVMAEWILMMELRQDRLNQAVAIPPHAEGKFRMSEADQQELWKFTLAAVETYGHELKEELEEILETSEFSKECQPHVERIMDSFYSRSGARPGQDIPVVASFLLRQLLGDEILETLEQTDEKLVLSPKMAEEDEHLVFWSSLCT